jgi:hypothetical protein
MFTNLAGAGWVVETDAHARGAAEALRLRFGGGVKAADL